VNLTLEEVIEKVDNFELNNDCQTDNQWKPLILIS
jgi:hypothetical protein